MSAGAEVERALREGERGVGKGRDRRREKGKGRKKYVHVDERCGLVDGYRQYTYFT